GLRVTPARMGVGTMSTTRALWRFDGGVSVSMECTTSGGCNGFNCLRYTYTYTDANGSDPMLVGRCRYENSSGDCSTSSGLYSSRLPPMGLAISSCPVSPPATGANTLFTTSGQFGSAGTFTGVNSGSVAYSATWDRPESYTLSAWIQTSGASSQTILSHENPLQPEQYWGFGLVDGSLRHFDSRDSAADPDVSLGSGLTDGAWHKVDVVRVNGSKRYFYIDGVQIGNTVATSTDSFAAHPISSAVFVGDSSAGGEAFVGDIDEIRVMDSALSADDLMLEYQGTFHKYSSDAGVSYTTTAASFVGGPPSNGTTATWTYTPAETGTSNSRWIFLAQSTQTSSAIKTPLLLTLDSSLPIAPTLSGAANGTNSIDWSWGLPSNFCPPPGSGSVYYELIDAVGGGVIGGSIVYPLLTTNETVSGSPNQLRSRHLRVTDVWGTSPLSNSATVYTEANPPSLFSVATVSTGGAAISWNANSNPSYTRYEATYSPDNFTATTSTRLALSDNFTQTTTNLTGLSPGTTYYVRIRAFNGRSSDFYGGTRSASFAGGSFVTAPSAPVLTGTPLSNSSVRWDWTPQTGASGYSLYDGPTGALMATGGLVTFTSATLSVNTRYDAQVEAFSTSATGARGSAFTYTLANPPLSPTVSQMYFSSGTLTWGANGNPTDTFYEVSVATGPTYGVVIATLSVAGTTITLSNLLPGTSYYARVRAYNGLQVPAPAASFVVFSATSTRSDPAITISSAPSSPYVSQNGLVGSWQFDEGGGLTSNDGSGNGNTAQFGCTAYSCASTPTFAAGPPGLGTSASFAGLSYGAVSLSSMPFAFTDDLSVEAWVYPQTASQQDQTGIIARGLQGGEDFALDVFSGRLRFLATPGYAALADALLSAGTWIHAVGVYDSAAATAKLYLNGVVAAPVATGVPARTNSTNRTPSIGNRQDASGNYIFPFYGRIDAVRVLHRALTDSEVLADYQGSFVSTVTPPSPNSGVLVGLPPNAFSAPAQIYVSADPVGHPIRILPATLAAGLASTPAGLTLAPGSIVEIVPIVGGLPFTASLGSSATVSIPYADADADNLIDGVLPPLSASALSMYALNTTVNRWEALPTAVDAAQRRAVGLTPHFSVFALFAPSTVGTNLSGVRVYPVPWKPGSGGRFDAVALNFDHLPSSGRIRILTMAGEHVVDLRYDGASAGAATWNGRTQHGRLAASGVYYAKIESDAGGSVIVKFAVEK
ncbi:MAG TPA: hypothetical protein DCZ01_06705, partial [Elusimicrobia bacterium]|nr:hypothetical protein [Elusimicrobiota bacterium]